MKRTHSGMRKAVILAPLAAVLAIWLAVCSFAWIGLTGNTVSIQVSGSLVEEYFHCGSGTADDPFVITRPIHYYHMVEFFQRLTALPTVHYGSGSETGIAVKFGEDYLYFQIGCSEDRLYDPTLDPALDTQGQCYVFDYSNTGEIQKDANGDYQKSQVLNMAYYSGDNSLMPVGTSEVPFNGQLDGMGVTVKNLYVTTTDTVVVSGQTEAQQRSTCDVGVFGYIGPGGVVHGDTTNTVVSPCIKNVYYEDLTIDLTQLDASKITTTIEGQTHTNTTEIHNSSVCYAGYIAGHLTTATSVTDVYINNARFIGGEAAESDYGYFGCVENKDTGKKSVTLGSMIAEARGAGSDAGFGGSIDMKNLLQRLQGVWNASNQPTTYNSVETVIINEVTNSRDVTSSAPRNITYAYNTYRYRYYASEYAGKYYFFERNDMSNYQFMQMYGETSLNKKNVTQYTLLKDSSTGTYKVQEGFTLSSGSNYLCINGTNAYKNDIESNATTWFMDSSGHIYTQPIGLTNEGADYIFTDAAKYYLNASESGMSVSTSPSTIWTFDNENGTLSFFASSTQYYLIFDSVWLVSPYTEAAYLYDGNGHFVSTSGTGVSSVSSEGTATYWFMSSTTSDTFFMKRVNGVPNYLYPNNGSLAIRENTSFTWNKDSLGYYTAIEGVKHYITYDGAWKLVPVSGYKISDGNGNYLSADSSSVSGGNEAAGTVWQISSMTGNTSVFTIIDGIKYYLTNDGEALGISTESTDATWTWSSGGGLYREINNVRYYLDYSDGWKLYRDSNFIHDNDGHYLSADKQSSGTQPSDVQYFVRSTGIDDATHWYLSDISSEDGTETTFSYDDNGTTRYLHCSEGVLDISTDSTTWIKDGNNYYTENGGVKYYLTYDEPEEAEESEAPGESQEPDESQEPEETAESDDENETAGNWIVTPLEGFYIHSGEYYLNADIDDTTAEETIWQKDSDGHIFTQKNGDKVYLRIDEGELTADADTENSIWTQDGNSYYVTIADIDYFLTYDNEWKVMDLQFFTIHDNNGHYLKVNGESSFISVGENSATHFYFSSVSGENPKGKAYCVVDDNKYYLCVSDSGSLITNENDNQATIWDNDGDSVFYVDGSVTYSLQYDNAWKIKISGGYYISDGTNYMKITGSDIGNSTTQTDATLFIFSNSGTNPSGSIRILGTNNYLTNNNGNLEISTTSTNWSNNGNNLYSTHQTTGWWSQTVTSYLRFDQNWQLSTSSGSSTYYRLKSGSNYMSVVNGTTLSVSTNSSEALLWNAQSGTMRTTVNGTQYYLYCERNNNGSVYLNNSTRNWTNSSQKLYYARNNNTNYYLRLNNSTWTVVTNQNNSSDISFEAVVFSGISKVIDNEASRPEVKVDETSLTSPEITFDVFDYTLSYPVRYEVASSFEPVMQYNEYNMTPNCTVQMTSVDVSVTVFDTSVRLAEMETKSNVNGGYQTYLPLRIATDEETGWYTSSDPYRVSRKNTGYIISGARIQETNTSDQQKGAGDIRISYFPISSISPSYTRNSAEFSNIYTIDGNGNHTLTNAQKTDTYNSAASQLLQTLQGQSSVYGLHFMDARISTDYLLTADKAVILDKEYDDYELPLDSIDFNVVERGTINFFAGTYYTDNNAFFSLHQVFRDSNQKITAIKEISEVYEHNTLGNKRNFIYKFTDNTYSNMDGKYTGATTLDSNYNPTPVFRTSWITNPGRASDLGYTSTPTGRIYYFEIPCNKGEYCLGSVSGKTGAYLIYLDIAANGGEVSSQVISAEGLGDFDAFKVDVRSATDTLADGEYTVLTFATNAPANATEDTFDVTVDFDKTGGSDSENDIDYTDGLYTITVLNKTGEDINLDVMLCDDDHDPETPFKYAYQIKYINETHTTATLIFDDDEISTYQAMATFIIPSSGDAEESTYQS